MAARNCAVCLITLQSPLVCGLCRKRAYCSQDCQRKDWSETGKYQGHKRWCGLSAGEEGVDWRVEDYGPKGLGLCALRPFEALERIMVERPRAHNDPVISDLAPATGSYREKIQLNRLPCLDGKKVLCARMARANHSCNSNAFHWYDPTLDIKTLIASRKIQKGEEICISYQPWDDPSSELSPEDARRGLNKKWGIVCEVGQCRCYDSRIVSKVEESKSLDKMIYSKAATGDVDGALESADRLFTLLTIDLGRQDSSLMRLYYDRYQISIMKRKGLRKGQEFIREALRINSILVHPSSTDKDWQEFLEGTKRHRNYLIFER